MIKSLKKKFVLVAMTSVTLVLFAVLATLNIVNATFQYKKNTEMLEILCRTQISVQPHRPAEPEKRFFIPMPSEDNRLSAVFFSVIFNTSGEIVKTDVSRIVSVDEDAAERYAKSVYEKEEGRISKFRFMSKTTDNGRAFVFLDISSSMSNIFFILVLSLAVFLATFLFMLVITVLISRKAIAPIERNIERQKQFITDAGHEIKTPLAIILSNTEALELHEGESKWTRNIKEETERLSLLTANLLTLSRLDESGYSPTLEKTDITALLKKTLEGYTETIKAKSLTIDTYIGQASCNASPELFERLLSVVLDNAVGYSNEGGRIAVGLKRENDGILLKVMNTVETLPDAPPEKLFDRFFRGDKARTHNSGGFGIGLSSARSIIEAHGGKIYAEYGDGTVTIVIKV